MKQQKINRRKPPSSPVVVDERRARPEARGPQIRTVLYVEVGDMEADRINIMINEVNNLYGGSDASSHYAVPVRHGKIGTDVVFENEILDVIRKLCEIKDGQICLKGGAREVQVVRQSVQ